MALSIDSRVGNVRRQFAEQIKFIHPEIEDMFNEGFAGDETPDFYEGLLSAFCHSYQICRICNSKDAMNIIGQIIAKIAEFTLNKE